MIINKSSIMLTGYPLSSSFEYRVRELFANKTQTITVAQLRSQGIVALIRQLWSINGVLIALPIEEENSTALLPVLKLLAAFTRADSICVVYPDLKIESVSRWRIAWGGCHFAAACVACWWAAYSAMNELSSLLSKDRVNPRVFLAKSSVLYLKTNLWFGIKAGGSVGHIAGVVNGFKHLGHQVTFASAEPPVMINEEVNYLPVTPPAAFGLPYELNNYRFQKEFYKLVESSGVVESSNLIYQRLSAANYLGVLLSRRYQIPLIVEYNGSEVWVAKQWGRPMKFQKLAEMAEAVMLSQAHLVVTISNVLRDELIQRGVDPKRIATYPNCIDPAIFDPERFQPDMRKSLRAHYGIEIGATVLAFIGTFGQWHGVETMALAIVRLYKEERQFLATHKVHFLLVGDGLKMQEVRSIIEENGAAEVCTLTGLVPQEQAALHLAASDILVSPHVPNTDGTPFFGSPTKLFEYMAMGKGIVASNLDQIGEVLTPALDVHSLPDIAPSYKSSEMAVLYEPGNLEGLVQGMKFLIERQDWREFLGGNARLAAIDKFTWNHHVKVIMEGVRKVLMPV